MTVDALRHILQRTGDWEMFMLTITCLWHQSIAVMSTAMVKLLVLLKVTIPEVYVLHPWLPCIPFGVPIRRQGTYCLVLLQLS